jgi:para-nitrobenzyl esterase
MRAWIVAIALALSACANPQTSTGGDQVRTASGIVQGLGAQTSGVRLFRGIPYAAPPIGENRWRAPQPVAAWEGVREAKEFGPRCIPTMDFDDMVFRSAGQSED